MRNGIWRFAHAVRPGDVTASSSSSVNFALEMANLNGKSASCVHDILRLDYNMQLACFTAFNAHVSITEQLLTVKPIGT